MVQRFLILILLLSPAATQAQEIAPLASHTVTTVRRTLRVLPFKGLITGEKGWRRVTKALVDAPPQPKFEQGQVCALVVADVSGGAQSWISKVSMAEAGILEVTLTRVEALRPSLNPSLKAFFLVVPATFQGVKLVHATRLLGGAGSIDREFPALPSDAERQFLPRLGPDLRLSFEMADGSPPPAEVQLRYEAAYPRGGEERRGKERAISFPSEGLPFPRIRDGARHTYAAFASGLRSRKPLVISRLPRHGRDGSPLPIKHVFVLEPVRR